MRVAPARRAAAALTATALLAIAGCSGSEPEAEADAETVETTEAAPAEPAEPAKDENCLPVSKSMLRAIAQGAEDAKIRPASGAAYRSDDYSEVYMIAMEFNGLGSPERGVWASNSMKPSGGLIMSVDGIAQEFTVWPNGTADSPLKITDHGAQEAPDCLG